MRLSYLQPVNYHISVTVIVYGMNKKNYKKKVACIALYPAITGSNTLVRSLSPSGGGRGRAYDTVTALHFSIAMVTP